MHESTALQAAKKSLLREKQPPGLKPEIFKTRVSAGLKTRQPRTEVRGWHNR